MTLVLPYHFDFVHLFCHRIVLFLTPHAPLIGNVGERKVYMKREGVGRGERGEERMMKVFLVRVGVGGKGLYEGEAQRKEG